MAVRTNVMTVADGADAFLGGVAPDIERPRVSECVHRL